MFAAWETCSSPQNAVTSPPSLGANVKGGSIIVATDTVLTMGSPPITQPGRGDGATNQAFSQTNAFFPAANSSHSSSVVPMNMLQLHQLQALQQQQQQQQSQYLAQSGVQPVNAGLSVPNQFFMSTSMAQGAAPSSASIQQMQAAAMQQAVFASNTNANIPFLINDPNVYMQTLQQQQALQKSPQMTLQSIAPFSTMPANVQLQQQPMMHQFSVFPAQC